mgnify:CR=1 FL=1
MAAEAVLSEGFADFFIAVGDEGEGQCVFVAEALLRCRAVDGDTEDLDVARLQFVPCVTQAASLFSAAWSERLGVEKDHAGTLIEGGAEVDGGALVVDRGDLRG